MKASLATAVFTLIASPLWVDRVRYSLQKSYQLLRGSADVLGSHTPSWTLFYLRYQVLTWTPAQPALSEVDEVVHLVSRAVARKFRDLLPPHPTGHPFPPNVGGHWSGLYLIVSNCKHPKEDVLEESRRMPGLPSLHQQYQPRLPGCTN